MADQIETPRLIDLDAEPELSPGVVKDGKEYALATTEALAGNPKLRYRINAIEARIDALEKKGEKGTITEVEEAELDRIHRERVGLFIPAMPSEVLAALSDEQIGMIIMHLSDHLIPLVQKMRGAATEESGNAGQS